MTTGWKISPLASPGAPLQLLRAAERKDLYRDAEGPAPNRRETPEQSG